MGWRGGWGGRGGWSGPWPSRGPFSYLPPWQRPGRLFGRGACWWLFDAPYAGYGYAPYMPYYPLMPPRTHPQISTGQPSSTRTRTGTTQQTIPYMYQPALYPQTPYYMPTIEEELAMLEEAEKDLEEEIKGTRARIEELKSSMRKKVVKKEQ